MAVMRFRISPGMLVGMLMSGMLMFGMSMSISVGRLISILVGRSMLISLGRSRSSLCHRLADCRVTQCQVGELTIAPAQWPRPSGEREL
jgi:hypothetical protein